MPQPSSGKLAGQTVALDRRAQRALERDEPGAVMICEVLPDGPARRAGLERGDLLLALEGEPITGSLPVIRPVPPRAGAPHTSRYPNAETLMAQEPNLLAALSDQLTARFAATRDSVAAIRLSGGAHLGAILWRDDALVTSEQSLPARPSFEALLADGSCICGALAGRDPATNVAVIRLDKTARGPALSASVPDVGALVIAAGSDGAGRPSARLGLVNAVGPEWHSMRGGRIEARVQLDIRLAASEEGGPAFDAAGGWLGMTTFGPRGQVLVIPAATVERIAPALLAGGRVPRGWLGAALRPVTVPDELRDAAGEATGLMVMSLSPEGPAATAGIVPGEIILSVDGTSARRLRNVLAHLGSDSIGKTASLRVIRGGAVITIGVTIAERPEA